MRAPYPSGRSRCDLVVNVQQPSERWYFEVKMARLAGDNNRPDDTALKDVLSPYPSDRSALTDCQKLLTAPPDARKAVLIYGFDWLPKRPLGPIIVAFETLARILVVLGPRAETAFSGLVHGVHASGRVLSWEVREKAN